MKRKNIPSLTSLRFFAATLVVIFHYEDKHLIFPVAVTSFGYEAVMFFFVLSGFILTYTHITNEEGVGPVLDISDRDFIIHRFSRVMPSYLLALLISAPFFLYSYFVAKTIDLNLFVLGLMLVPMLAQSWCPPASMLWNTPAWSLSVEAFLASSLS